MKYVVFFVALLIFASFRVFSSEESEDFFEEEGDYFDLESIFEGAEDISEPLAAEESETEEKTEKSALPFFVPLKFSGRIAAEVGLAFVRDDGENDYTGYLDFSHYLAFDSRLDKTIAVHGSLKTARPSGQWLELYELYVNYLMLDKIYICAGKKSTVWGNTRIFSDANDEFYDNDTDAHYTNILYDSIDSLSGVVTIPLWTGTVTAVALYDGNATSPTSDDISVALSVEMIVKKTSVNVFARRFPSEDGARATKHQNPILGMELKRTIFGFDVYAQELSRIQDVSAIKSAFSSRGSDMSAFSRFVSTLGIYRWWNIDFFDAGFNVEVQDVFAPNAEEDKHSDKIALNAGVSRLGKNRNIKVGTTWKHDFFDKKGLLKLGVSVSDIFPHASWRTGVEWDYDKEKSKIILGTYIKINMNY